MPPVHHRTLDLDGIRVFYREAGPPDAPVVLLPHGYPCSSFQYRNFMPALADRWRLIAPAYPGFGYSDTPPPDRFAYTFDGYASLLERFATALSLKRYALYLHDYGSQIGLRLAIRAPARVAALMSRLPPDLWKLSWQLMRPPGAPRGHGGHWALETNLDEVVKLSRDFLGRVHGGA